MKQCPNCDFENIRNRFYCEQCGTILPSSASQQVKTSTSRSQEYASSTSQISRPLSSPISTSNFISSEGPAAPLPSRTHNTLYTMARIVLYMVGAMIAAFGLYTLLAVFTHSAIIGFLSLFPGCIIPLIITFSLQRAPVLNWWQRLSRILAATCGTFVLLLIGAVIVGIQSAISIDRVANIVYGSIILTYGMVIAVLALY